ncbi:MAG: hypothetical protein ACKKL4_01660 [Patescibacteria group bacterium]
MNVSIVKTLPRDTIDPRQKEQDNPTCPYHREVPMIQGFDGGGGKPTLCPACEREKMNF